MSGPLRFNDDITPTDAMRTWLDGGRPQFEALAKARYGDLAPQDAPIEPAAVEIADALNEPS